MREEIIPEMMKNPKLNLEGLDEDAEDHNPEWEEWIDRSGITDKLRELGELQMSGADVYMSTFSQLKQFPFFRKISHWFYPFDPQYQDIAKLSLGNDEQKNLSAQHFDEFGCILQFRQILFLFYHVTNAGKPKESHAATIERTT